MQDYCDMKVITVMLLSQMMKLQGEATYKIVNKKKKIVSVLKIGLVLNLCVTGLYINQLILNFSGKNNYRKKFFMNH